MSNQEKISQADLALINDLNAAMQTEKHRGIFAVIILFFAFLVVFVIWAYHSPLEEVTRGQGSVIPTSREQIVQSLDPGIIREMKVKEGDIVEKDQILLTLDDTRSSAMLRESKAKVLNLQAVATRLQAEAYGMPLKFSADIPRDIQAREKAAYQARLRAMSDAVKGLTQSKALLDREIALTSPMVRKGVMSEVELLRTKRQSADLAQQIAERKNRYAAEANEELVRTESELAQAKETLAMYADPVERSQIKAPLRGIVKNIKINTVGGVVQAGQDILEIVPPDEKLPVQAYISPKDVAFIRNGQAALVKISAYDYAIYGGLEGKVTLISPDTLQDDRTQSTLKLNPEESYYRILIETNESKIFDKNGNPLDITPGMTATVDIRTGEKTIFQYLIKPITRMKQAMQER
ncbi:HlyD family type I secretion periplasmic adaptor subunit [Actinobacillus equuli subsp. haemolyticus]|uniref:HlyD family type I secretion periplasmic adaptor subunit n=1 Tax=Actinobacillus equuli TaxID=718 RepID=UPI0024420DAD|nr:HlyD family type I secretion periplasmic adaptor subunit [Actinobacillus equuli]WGE76501.1 HlyD family type I secretion periplasmic adaptor subunit [Actinobacillus equuli subsp. haemolyticus]